MKMMLTFFTLLMFPGALSFSVIGYTGGAVTITCQYDRGYRRNVKYFCRRKEVFMQKCSDVIRTDIKDEWFEDGRFSLYDDTTASVFNVTITDLNEQDSDTYRCAVDRFLLGDIYTEVKLNVRKDDCCKKIISLSVPSGGSVNISCKYPQTHRTDVKLLCERSGADICAHVRQTRDGDHDVLFITNVTDLRSAEYWCALQTEDHRYKTFLTRVHITVTETTRSRPSLTTTTSSTLCLSSVQSALVTSASPVTSSAFPDSLLIVSLSVALVLIITGVLMMTVMLCKRRQTSDADSDGTISHSGPGIYELVTHDYDEIKDIRHMTDFESATITDCNAAPLPTVPSDATNAVYYPINLTTIPSDASNSVYNTLQFPTIPSDASNTVYNTLQLPTIPSDASNTVYAAPR